LRPGNEPFADIVGGPRRWHIFPDFDLIAASPSRQSRWFAPAAGRAMAGMTIDTLKPRVQALLRPVVWRLAALGITAYQVTRAALLGSLAAAVGLGWVERRSRAAMPTKTAPSSPIPTEASADVPAHSQ
jgi:hypothetical protein